MRLCLEVLDTVLSRDLIEAQDVTLKTPYTHSNDRCLISGQSCDTLTPPSTLIVLHVANIVVSQQSGGPYGTTACAFLDPHSRSVDL